MKTAVLFGGQGTQYVGIGQRLAEASPFGRSLLDRVSEQVGVDVRRLAAQGRPELERTEILQPLLVAVAMGTWRWWRERAAAAPAVVAGHSLGELSAWAASGEIDAIEAVDLAVERGRIMAAAAAASPGSMAAFRTADRVRLVAAAARGGLSLAAVNTPEDLVFAGPRMSLRSLARRFEGGVLAVSGPWHSPGMAAAVEPFERAAAALKRKPRQSVWLSAASGAPVGDAPRELARHLVQPIDWVSVVASLLQRGVERFVVLGPGRPLRTWVRRNARPSTPRIEVYEEPSEDEVVPCA